MVMDHIDRARYIPVLVSIDAMRWVAFTANGEADIDRNDFSYEDAGMNYRPDICLIMIHGTPGEDGKLQGYFDMIGMRYTTGSVLNTSLTFNKLYTSQLLRHIGFDAARGVLLQHPDDLNIEALGTALHYPMFVKPNEGGSSLGVSKVKKADELTAAVALAFSKGSSVIVEEFMKGREVTCGVLCMGNAYKALAITEITTRKEFFDFAAKYQYDQTEEITPADLPEVDYLLCQEISERIARAFDCKGVVRIDFKYEPGRLRPIEINTVPGMTAQSLVPQQAAAVGIDKTALITKIIEG
jgi:D-alanine-D-alanine ligase